MEVKQNFEGKKPIFKVRLNDEDLEKLISGVKPISTKHTNKLPGISLKSSYRTGDHFQAHNGIYSAEIEARGKSRLELQEYLKYAKRMPVEIRGLTSRDINLGYVELEYR